MVTHQNPKSIGEMICEEYQNVATSERISNALQNTGEYIYKGIRAFERENNLPFHNVEFAGLLPSPSTFEYYEKNWPGAIDRILTLGREYMDKDYQAQMNGIKQREYQVESLLQSPIGKIHTALAKIFK